MRARGSLSAAPPMSRMVRHGATVRRLLGERARGNRSPKTVERATQHVPAGKGPDVSGAAQEVTPFATRVTSESVLHRVRAGTHTGTRQRHRRAVREVVAERRIDLTKIHGVLEAPAGLQEQIPVDRRQRQGARTQIESEPVVGEPGVLATRSGTALVHGHVVSGARIGGLRPPGHPCRPPPPRFSPRQKAIGALGWSCASRPRGASRLRLGQL